MQKFVNEIGIPITLCHFPPATSKWNVIEHQIFSFISINWRAKPLTSLAVILELISQTTTQSALNVTAMSDTNTYQTKIKVTDAEIKLLNIQREDFHGEWKYTISPLRQYTSVSRLSIFGTIRNLIIKFQKTITCPLIQLHVHHQTII